jgi:hypothetical protein
LVLLGILGRVDFVLRQTVESANNTRQTATSKKHRAISNKKPQVAVSNEQTTGKRQYRVTLLVCRRHRIELLALSTNTLLPLGTDDLADVTETQVRLLFLEWGTTIK